MYQNRKHAEVRSHNVEPEPDERPAVHPWHAADGRQFRLTLQAVRAFAGPNQRSLALTEHCIRMQCYDLDILLAIRRNLP